MCYRSVVPADWMIGTLFQHSKKAIKQGEPSDRVFAVVGIVDDQGRSFYLAWKCTRLKNGKISHPAFKEPLDPEDKRLFRKTSKNGSTPTAMFRPDSRYAVVPLAGDWTGG